MRNRCPSPHQTVSTRPKPSHRRSPRRSNSMSAWRDSNGIDWLDQGGGFSLMWTRAILCKVSYVCVMLVYVDVRVSLCVNKLLVLVD